MSLGRSNAQGRYTYSHTSDIPESTEVVRSVTAQPCFWETHMGRIPVKPRKHF